MLNNTHIKHALAVPFILFRLNKIQISGVPGLPTDAGAQDVNLIDRWLLGGILVVVPWWCYLNDVTQAILPR